MKYNYWVVPGITSAKKIRRDVIISVVCSELNVTWDRLISKTRVTPIPDSRKILVYCLKKFSPYWFKTTTVGKLLSRDHSSVIAMLHAAENLKEGDRVFSEKLNKVIMRLKTYDL